MGVLWPIKKKEPIRLIKQRLPRHIAIAIDVSDQDAPTLQVMTIQKLIELQIRLGIPVMTFNILPYRSEAPTDALVEALGALNSWTFLTENDVKISVLGRWYDLPERVVDMIKEVILRTKDHEGPIVNIGVNYDGQEELVDAMSRIARQVKAQKVDPERITKETVKMNLDTALLAAPDLIITTGKTFSLRGFMIWDSSHAKIFFSNISWNEFKRDTLLKALVFYQNTRAENGKTVKSGPATI
ncbi:MAG: undecaprenyl diphosphate synthase family protein [Nanoarchaeota archaeon]|mgnify:CR=1 FL=1